MMQGRNTLRPHQGKAFRQRIIISGDVYSFTNGCRHQTKDFATVRRSPRKSPIIKFSSIIPSQLLRDKILNSGISELTSSPPYFSSRGCANVEGGDSKDRSLGFLFPRDKLRLGLRDSRGHIFAKIEVLVVFIVWRESDNSTRLELKNYYYVFWFFWSLSKQTI